MLIRIDAASPMSLNEQIAAGIRRAIADGAISPGDRLPSGKELAASLDVNMHTVLKAYARLRDEELLDMRRGRGVHVANTAATHGALVELSRQLVADARRAGLAPDEIRNLLEVQL